VRHSKAQVLLVTDANSLPEQWAASVIVGRFCIQELLGKHPDPVFIKIGRQAKDHVNVTKEHLFANAEHPSQVDKAEQPRANRAESQDQIAQLTEPPPNGVTIKSE
jgi:hypothetical protein